MRPISRLNPPPPQRAPPDPTGQPPARRQRNGVCHHLSAASSYGTAQPPGSITSSASSFANGWVNPYRYDGRDRVRYDEETGLYWMSVQSDTNFDTNVSEME